MSTKHFFASTEGVVLQGLESLVARNTCLALDADHKVVYSKTHSSAKVAVISGGGSGHEPAWSGYVGDGMLAAAVNGEVFASPSTKQVMAAIDHVASGAGIILCITNYTGDNLHFGLAREKATGLGYKIDILRMTDDVALGRKQTENTGRRGLAANMFVLKLCGSAAQEGYSFEDCMRIGLSVNANAVTVGSSLDHCHIPGREHHRAIPKDAYVLGMGIHNEPGLHEITPMPGAETLIRDMLKYCLDPSDGDRAFVNFQPTDVVLLLVNNFGGMSNFELEALTNVTRKILEVDWQIVPRRIFAQCFETSLNAPGWSISLLNVSGIEREADVPVSTLLSLLDTETTAPAWPRNGYLSVEGAQAEVQKATHAASNSADCKGPSFDRKSLDSALRSAANAAIAAEPDLTRWDAQMGDGDCGEAVVGICRGIIDRLNSGMCREGTIFETLDRISEAVEVIGGTLAAIISIMLASFTTTLRKACIQGEVERSLDVGDVGRAAKAALSNLMKYTSARTGGRTVMDTLIPFCEELDQHGDLTAAVDAAEKAAQATAGMEARFGRASYVGDTAGSHQNNPPDPGAKAAAIFLRGFLNGLRQ